MKKKIISLLTMFCLILPCFLATACKDKSEPKETKAYTYSVVLKNAKGKIDENVLQDEYDYKKQENVSWISSGDDYQISVTRTNAVTDDFEVSLLEGYDYSNLIFSVNSEETDGEVKSGSKTGCEKDAYLTDRQFHYGYEDMKSDTEFVLDFSDCAWGKVSVNLSELSLQGIKSYTAVSDFVTLDMQLSDALVELQSDFVEVDYGTVFAFDCAEKLMFQPSASENYQSLTYSKYASKYYIGSNMVQYFTAKQDGDCRVYNAIKDYSKRGTLRILGCSDISVYSSEDLDENNVLSTEIEKEYYGGALLKLNVVKSTRMFLEITGDAEKYNYYLVNSIEEKLSITNELEQKTLNGTDRVYLDIDIANADGSSASAKYLLRKPKSGTNYYIVYADDFADNTRIANADYILVGSQNKPQVPSVHDGCIYFGFEKQTSGGQPKNVEIELSAYTSDTATDFVHKNTSVSVMTTNYLIDGSPSDRTIETISESPLQSSSLVVECYNEEDYGFYEIFVLYTSERFNESLVTLDASDFELYDGEVAYYTTNLKDSSSWQVLTTETNLSISSNKSRTIYYYIESDRADAFLQIQNPDGEVVSLTGELKDCFGRQMKGTVTVGEVEINLSKIRFLDIEPGDYSAYTAKLLREYDKTYHKVNLNGLANNTLMLSFDGYVADGSSFKNVNTLAEFKLKYYNYENSSEIYYYIDADTNKYLAIKNSDGEIVSTSTCVYKTNLSALEINGNFVYLLTLNGGYYAENEEFYIEIVDATYSLTYEDGEEIELFSDSTLTESEEFMVAQKEYYFVGELNKTYIMIDSDTNAVVVDFDLVSEIDSTTGVYKFTFSFPSNSNYVCGTTFKLRVLDQQ